MSSIASISLGGAERTAMALVANSSVCKTSSGVLVADSSADPTEDAKEATMRQQNASFSNTG